MNTSQSGGITHLPPVTSFISCLRHKLIVQPMFAPDHWSAKYRWVIRLGVVLVLVLTVALIADWLFHPQRFPIQQVQIRCHAPALAQHSAEQHERQCALDKVVSAQVKEVVWSTLSGNFFSLNLPQLEQAVKEIPGVFSSSIRQRWPSTVVVDVVEIKPVAKWHEVPLHARRNPPFKNSPRPPHARHSMWINFTGDLITMPTELALGETDDLPILSGSQGDSELVWNMFQRGSGLFARANLKLDSVQHRLGIWTFEVSQQPAAAHAESVVAETTTLIVGQEQITEKINRALNVLNAELITQIPPKQRHLSPQGAASTTQSTKSQVLSDSTAMDARPFHARFADIRSIDLRYPNGFAIMWRDEGTNAVGITPRLRAQLSAPYSSAWHGN